MPERERGERGKKERVIERKRGKEKSKGGKGVDELKGKSRRYLACRL